MEAAIIILAAWSVLRHPLVALNAMTYGVLIAAAIGAIA